MDTNNWRPTAAQGAEPSVETGGDWRTQLPTDSRQRIVNKIMETLKRHLPFSGQEGLEELKKIAVRFEENIYTAAMSQSDYLRKISLKMLTMESKSQTTIPNSLPPNPSGNNNRPSDSGASHNMQQQQQQQQQQQHLMAQQNNLSSMHQQQLGSQSNVSGLQQQQLLLGTQPGNSTMQTNQHSLHMLRPKVPLQQQAQQNASNMQPAQGQQSQQQLMSHMQSQPTQLQQQLGLQQPNQIQRDMQPGLQASGQAPGSMLQQQNVIDQQKQLYQSQRPLPETSSTSLDSTAQTGNSNGGDWQEEVYQKIKAMKEMYLPELNEMHQKISLKLQQSDFLPQPPKSEQLEKLKLFKTMLERILAFLQVPKTNIQPSFREKLGSYEKQIINFISSNKVRKPIPPHQQGNVTNFSSHSGVGKT